MYSKLFLIKVKKKTQQSMFKTIKIYRFTKIYCEIIVKRYVMSQTYVM